MSVGVDCYVFLLYSSIYSMFEAFDAVMAAVNNGTISEDRINQSVRRILKLRKSMNR